MKTIFFQHFTTTPSKPIVLLIIACSIFFCTGLHAQDPDSTANNSQELYYHTPPAFSSLGGGLNSYFSVSLPNMHLKSGLDWLFGDGNFEVKGSDTKGLYVGIYVTGGEKSRFGVRAIYFMRPITSRLNFYPLAQTGFRYLENENDQGTSTEVRLGGGIQYRILGNEFFNAFLEVGTGVTPAFLGITFPLFWKNEKSISRKFY